MSRDADIVKSMFEALGFKVVDVPDYSNTHPFPSEAKRLAPMSDAAVKALWDDYDGGNAPRGFSGEAIHLELNQRGLGRYCAV